MKKKEDSFIGTQFPTPKGGTLTIKEVYSSGKHPKYICTCSICSIDKEMFPYGSIIGDKSILRNGGCCCGCSKSSRWNEDQNYIRVKRKCSETGYIFHGWYGEYNKSKTYLDLENPETGNRWNSTNLDSFLRGCGDPIGGLESRKRSRAKSIDQHLKSFYEAGIKEDYILWAKDDQRLPYYYWCYICPVCSYDEYVKSGVCSGVFESHYKSLKEGSFIL